MNQTLSNATFQRRLAAMFYDALLLFAIVFIAATPLVLIAGGAESPFIKGPVFKLYIYGISFFFFGWFWTHGGQTLGMRSWKLRVVRMDDQPLEWDSALYRYLLATVSLFLFGLGFLWILFDKNNLAWHDQLSKTRIIFDPEYAKKSVG